MNNHHILWKRKLKLIAIGLYILGILIALTLLHEGAFGGLTENARRGFASGLIFSGLLGYALSLPWHTLKH